MSTAGKPRVRLSREDRRKEILQEAIQAIGERGFHGFSVRDLAQRCGMTDAGLLHHFGTKINLLLALLDERDRQDGEAIAGLLAQVGKRDLRDGETIADLLAGNASGAPRTRGDVLRILIALARRNAERPELIRLYAMLHVEALAPDHPAHAYFITRDRNARAEFARFLAPVSNDPAALARRVLAALDGLEAQWLQESCGFDLAAEWECMIEGLIPRTGSMGDTE